MTQGEVPFSERFQDVYFSRDDGLAETDHVFLAGNNLPERWRNVNTFTIAETGFGTGLNLLAAWRLWRRTAIDTCRLHYISIEKYPLDGAAMASAHSLFPDLRGFSDELLDHMDDPLPGFHRYHLEQGRLVLTLCHGDVVDMLRQLSADVDCWFLDGFAPARNPDMWCTAVYREIARLSHVGTTFATFTVAGEVRRGLTAQGFRVEKRPGFGRKREMCAGVMETLPTYRPREPWFSPPRFNANDRRALVIGAGIAGAQVAHHLAGRGWQVDVLERHGAPGQEASGNPAAVFSPFLSARPSLEEQYSLQSFGYLQRQLGNLDGARTFHRRCGVLALSVNEALRERAARIAQRGLPSAVVRAVNGQEARALGGLETTQDGLYYPKAGWVKPAAWITALLNHEYIRLHTHADVAEIHYHDGHWSVTDESGNTLGSAPVLVVASGQSMQWRQCRWIPTTPVAGQTTLVESRHLRGQPACVLRYRGYLVPLEDHQQYLIGSTYRRGDGTGAMDAAADHDNWEALVTDLPTVTDSRDAPGAMLSSAHAAVRVTSENRLPIVGPLPDPDPLTREYSAMLRRGYQAPTASPVYPPGLYLSAAWGSRGMTNAALGGELLASLINNEPLPLQASIQHALHPARSLVRRLKQGGG